MLILTRNINKSIQIGDDVTVTILSVNGNQIKIGIDAPKDVGVHREEIYSADAYNCSARQISIESSAKNNNPV